MPVSSVTDGLSLLRTSWLTLTDGILRGQYAFWLGSGISRNRFPDVTSLLLLVLKRLHASIDAADPNCPRKKALRDIMDLTAIRDLPITDDPDSWPSGRRTELIQSLQEKYSDVLEQDVRIPGASVFITWDILKLHEMYGDPTERPDAEHRFVALLIEEGIIDDIITTNWDALVESAHEECRDTKPLTLQTVACGSELARNGCTSRLLKIHGCARKVRLNETVYRPFLIATRTDIRNWRVEQRFEPIKTAFMNILREKTAFFVGLSAQDWNIQEQCAEAAFGQQTFPTAPQKLYFAELGIRNSQRAILKAVYGQTAYNADAANIDKKAAVPVFAKTLLGSLYLLGITGKLKLIFDTNNPTLTTECRDLMASVFQQMHDSLLLRYDGIADEHDRWRAVADEIPYFVSRLLSMFRHRAPPSTRRAYEAISDKHIGQMEQASNQFIELQWLAFALTLLCDGANKTLWQLRVPLSLEGKEGQLLLQKGPSSIPVFLLQNDMGLPALMLGGFIDTCVPDRNIIIYPAERKRPVTRTTSPARILPGGPKPKLPNEIWLRGELEEVFSLAELFDNIKPQIALALAT